jgi:inorganic pyrophosphatase
VSDARVPPPLERLPPFDDEGNLHVLIDTPKGSRNKYKWDEAFGVFTLAGVLTVGAVFPYDFGDIPSTKGEDGDPLDVLVLMDEPAFVGCLVVARLLGALEAEQVEDGKTVRNDRLVAVAVKAPTWEGVASLADLSPVLLHQIEHFFVSYNAARGRRFTVRGRRDADEARAIVEAARVGGG